MSADTSCLLCSVGALSLPTRSQTISWICQFCLRPGGRVSAASSRQVGSGSLQDLDLVWKRICQAKKHCWFQPFIKCGELLRKKSEMRSSEGACGTSTPDEKGLRSKMMETHTDPHKNNTNNIMTDRKTELKRNYFLHNMVESYQKPRKTPLCGVRSHLHSGSCDTSSKAAFSQLIKVKPHLLLLLYKSLDINKQSFNSHFYVTEVIKIANHLQVQ